MQLNTSTDYAIRLILCLAKSAQTVSSSKLAASVGVSSRYLLQVGAKLRDAELITTTHGSAGGYALTKPPKAISLFDIILVMEERVKINQRNGSEESLAQTKFEILDTAYEYVDGVLCDILKSITIENLLSQSIEEWYLAPCLMSLNNKTRE